MVLAAAARRVSSFQGAQMLVVGLTAFLTVVDLFAAQAILPALVRAYQVSPAAMGLAVNASTVGMAVSGLCVALFGRRLDRRRGILGSLLALSVPTALLATMPSLPVFALLRVVQGLFMAAAFTLTLAYVAEQGSEGSAARASAAYITGNVASNLFGRLLAAAVADHLGLAWTFGVFAMLNLAGALVVHLSIPRTPAAAARAPAMPAMLAAWRAHLRTPALRAAFGLGFCVLFAFIGTFTYVNFVLVRPPFSLGMMSLGLIYFVFLPSVISTPLAGGLALRLGVRPTCWATLGLAAAGLPLLLLPRLPAVLLGLAIVGVGTFFAQAAATGFVGRSASDDRASASGLYLASYFLGGIVGTAVLGQLFDRFGWPACVIGIGLALAAGAALVGGMVPPAARRSAWAASFRSPFRTPVPEQAAPRRSDFVGGRDMRLVVAGWLEASRLPLPPSCPGATPDRPLSCTVQGTGDQPR
jgi:MFS transporter, YNFM family, putative membrane transport protein